MNFDDLQPILKGSKKRVFGVVGDALNEKQQKAGYYTLITSGTKLDGLFNGFETNVRFGNEEIRLADEEGNETIIRSCSSLKRQLAEIEVGSPVRLIYEGMKDIKTKAGKALTVHNWMVYA
jgi:hypothetical protein